MRTPVRLAVMTSARIASWALAVAARRFVPRFLANEAAAPRWSER